MRRAPSRLTALLLAGATLAAVMPPAGGVTILPSEDPVRLEDDRPPADIQARLLRGRAVAADGTWLLLTREISATTYELVLVDIARPGTPVEMSRLPLKDLPSHSAVDAARGLAYVTFGFPAGKEMRILRLPTLETLSVMPDEGTVITPSGRWVVRHGSGSESRIELIDAADTLHPRVAVTVVEGTIRDLAHDPEGLQPPKPASPDPDGYDWATVRGSASEAFAVEGRLYAILAFDIYEEVLYDLTDPARPVALLSAAVRRGGPEAVRYATDLQTAPNGRVRRIDRARHREEFYRLTPAGAVFERMQPLDGRNYESLPTAHRNRDVPPPDDGKPGWWARPWDPFLLAMPPGLGVKVVSGGFPDRTLLWPLSARADGPALLRLHQSLLAELAENRHWTRWATLALRLEAWGVADLVRGPLPGIPPERRAALLEDYATWLVRADRPGEAVQALRGVLAGMPDRRESWKLLGWALETSAGGLGDFDAKRARLAEAAAAYDRFEAMGGTPTPRMRLFRGLYPAGLGGDVCNYVRALRAADRLMVGLTDERHLDLNGDGVRDLIYNVYHGLRVMQNALDPRTLAPLPLGGSRPPRGRDVQRYFLPFRDGIYVLVAGVEETPAEPLQLWRGDRVACRFGDQD
ncbi:MAG TPA: hypothetical protein VED40_16850 [Azospirillaceae bacterium]|nr:hypothetical protein [Azospirillaceae bacterium]